MIMIYSLLQEGFPLLIIEKETKAKHVEFLAGTFLLKLSRLSRKFDI